MKRVPTTREFEKQTNLLELDDFNGLSIRPDLPDASFWNRRSYDLLEFCKKNPTYHIVSQPHYLMLFNFYIPTSQIFYLASGDNNPELVHYPNRKIAAYQDELVFKLWRDKLRTPTEEELRMINANSVRVIYKR